MAACSGDGLFQDCIDHVRDLAARALAWELARVSVGGSTTLQPHEFVIRELPESVEVTDVSTSRLGAGGARGRYRVTFNVACETWSQGRDLLTASARVNRWAWTFARAVAADKTLGGLCVHARPYVENGGSAVDTNKTSTAALRLGVTVDADIDPLDLPEDDEGSDENGPAPEEGGDETQTGD